MVGWPPAIASRFVASNLTFYNELPEACDSFAGGHSRQAAKFWLRLKHGHAVLTCIHYIQIYVFNASSRSIAGSCDRFAFLQKQLSGHLVNVVTYEHNMRPLLTFCMRPFKCIHNESLSHLCASRANNSVPCVALLHAHHWHMCKDYRRHKNLRRHKDCRQHKQRRQNERRHIHMHTPCAGTADIQRFLGYYVQERERFLHCRTFD